MNSRDRGLSPGRITRFVNKTAIAPCASTSSINNRDRKNDSSWRGVARVSAGGFAHRAERRIRCPRYSLLQRVVHRSNIGEIVGSRAVNFTEDSREFAVIDTCLLKIDDFGVELFLARASRDEDVIPEPNPATMDRRSSAAAAPSFRLGGVRRGLFLLR